MITGPVWRAGPAALVVKCPSGRIRRRRRRRCRRPAVAGYHFPKSCSSSDNTQWQPPGCRRSNRIRSTSTTRNPSMSTVLSSYRAEPCAVVPGLQLVLCLSALTVGGCARRRSTPQFVYKWAEDAQPVSCRVCMYSTPTVSERGPRVAVCSGTMFYNVGITGLRTYDIVV